MPSTVCALWLPLWTQARKAALLSHLMSLLSHQHVAANFGANLSITHHAVTFAGIVCLHNLEEFIPVDRKVAKKMLEFVNNDINRITLASFGEIIGYCLQSDKPPDPLEKVHCTQQSEMFHENFREIFLFRVMPTGIGIFLCDIRLSRNA